MQFHKQRFLHDPDKGQYGDCFRTALACVLDMEPEQVPHFMDGAPEPEEFWEAVNDWMAGNDCAWFSVPFAGELKGIQRTMKVQNPGLLYLIAGTSPRGTTHQCVGFEDRIIHDPHPEGGGLVGPTQEDELYWVNLILIGKMKFQM